MSSTAPVTDSDPDSVLMQVKQLQDQLARREMETRINDQQLALVYKHLLNLQDLIPGALVILSSDGYVQRVNDAAISLLGYQQSDFQSNFSQHIFPGVRELLAELSQRSDAQTHIKRQETSWTSKTNVCVPVLLSARAQVDGSGLINGFVLVAVDLTERRKLELELRQAQKLESIGQLAAGIAHEINTPMQYIGDNIEFVQSNIAGLLKTAQMTESMLHMNPAQLQEFSATCLAALTDLDLPFLNERMPRALDRALEGVKRVSRIVQAMRVFSHPNHSVEAVDLNAVVENALIICKHDYKLVADAVCHFTPLPAVQCNRGDITQVIINLVVNAAQAIKASGRHGAIDLFTRLSENQQSACIEVRDNGMGMPPAIQHRIFDPFFTTKAVGEGTGQGLAISRQIVVDRHGGSIRFDSVEGQGTTFYIELPLQHHEVREHD